jgi:hypothetical protein
MGQKRFHGLTNKVYKVTFQTRDAQPENGSNLPNMTFVFFYRFGGDSSIGVFLSMVYFSLWFQLISFVSRID